MGSSCTGAESCHRPDKEPAAFFSDALPSGVPQPVPTGRRQIQPLHRAAYGGTTMTPKGVTYML